jgi:protease IV
LGCRTHQFRLCADAHVTPELSSAGNSGRLLSMEVGREAPCDMPAVAIIEIDGLLLNMDMSGIGSLGENPVSLFRERLAQCTSDPCVRAIVLRINSPGGSVTATDVMWHEIQVVKARCHIPIVACIVDVGAGGGYYIASAADAIVAHPTSIVGGIGVILNLYNLQDAMAQYNVIGTPIKSGEHIDLGTAIHGLTPEQRILLEKTAREFHSRFQDIVVQSRGEADPDLETNFDGRVFTATEALNRQLIDSVGYLDDAIETAKQMARLKQARLVMYHRCRDEARTPYSTSPNTPIQNGLIPVSLPGLDRSRLPNFLYLWQPEPTMEKLGGR